MYSVYTSYYAQWRAQFGTSLFNHYAMAGAPGLPEFVYEWGYWSVLDGVFEDTAACVQSLPTLDGTESLSSLIGQACPKYKALTEQLP